MLLFIFDLKVVVCSMIVLFFVYLLCLTGDSVSFIMDPARKIIGRPKRSQRLIYKTKRFAKQRDWEKWRAQKIIRKDHCYCLDKTTNNSSFLRLLKIIRSDHCYSLDETVNNSSFPENPTGNLFFSGSDSGVPEETIEEQMVVDWEPSSARDFDEWESTYRDFSSSDYGNDELHEFSFSSEEEYNRVMAHEIKGERNPPPEQDNLRGHRIVDLHFVMNWAMEIQKRHSQICTFGEMKIENERHIGLVSVITFKCNLCERLEEHSTENRDYPKSAINYGAGRDTLTTRNTYTHLKKLLAALDIPCIIAE